MWSGQHAGLGGIDAGDQRRIGLCGQCELTGCGCVHDKQIAGTAQTAISRHGYRFRKVSAAGLRAAVEISFSSAIDAELVRTVDGSDDDIAGDRVIEITAFTGRSVRNATDADAGISLPG